MVGRLVLASMIAVAAASAVAAPAKRETGERSADGQEKVICKRFAETGSLVKTYRTCKTKREWERERDAIRAARGGNSCPNGEALC